MGDRVYLRAAPPVPFGTMPREVPRAFLLYTGVDPLNLGTHEGKGYLLSLTPFDAALTLELPMPLPFGCLDRRTPRHLTLQGRAATIYPAATGNAARSTLATDTPASTWVPGKLSGSFNYEISLFNGGDPLSGGSATIGILDLTDPDGELDGLRTLGWDGAPLQLLRGDPDAPFSTYEVVANLSTAGMVHDTRKKEIKLRDLAWRLNAAELHGLRYGGTGGVDGDEALAGLIKPYAIGEVFNITPTQINATALIYQVSCSSVLAIDTVSDGGVALTADADYATYALLAAATVAPGHFATCRALGLFKLGAAPVYIITADVRGDNDTINGLSYPNTRAEIARRIATGRGNLKVSDPDGIDLPAHQSLEQRQSATLGYFWNTEVTKSAALSEVMTGCLGWWCIRLDGRLAYGQLDDPSTLTPQFSLSYPTDANDGEVRVGEPAMVDYPRRRRATLIGWGRNYTPMSVNQIAGAVTQTDALVLRSEIRFAVTSDAWVSSAYPSAPTVSINGGFANASDAVLEGDRQQRLFRGVREAFEIAANIDPFGDYVARVITVNNSNRLGLGASRSLFCSGVAVNANGRPVLKLWG